MSIKFEHVNYIYAPNTPFEKQGLKDVSFELKENSFVAIVGHTGSGKSTLMQHFNGLLTPSTGQIKIENHLINSKTKNKDLLDLRKKVSLVFQFPESQLFETSVIKDIAFGPKNFGFDEKKAIELAYKWLDKVGLPREITNNSPFDLSGGQMRKVAIAGVMAYQPKILCLDEPAAGLDPASKKEMMNLFLEYKNSGNTVILVTHNMDDVANYADDVLVMEQGKMIKHDSPANVFANRKWVEQHSLLEPTASQFAYKLNNYHFKKNPLTMDELVKGIIDNLKR